MIDAADDIDDTSSSIPLAVVGLATKRRDNALHIKRMKSPPRRRVRQFHDTNCMIFF